VSFRMIEPWVNPRSKFYWFRRRVPAKYRQFGLPTEDSGGLGQILATVTNFDWLHLPGAVRAIARLVTGSADAGKAWIDVAKAKGEARSQRVRDLSKAQSDAMRSMAKAAIAVGTADASLVDRAVERIIAEQLPKQRSREAIGRETAKLLAHAPPNPDTPEPEDEWLNTFSAFAEKATTERMQQHWSSVLAGEIRKPGSFSLAALQILSVMDPPLAKHIAEVASWVFCGDHIPFAKSLERGENYQTLLSLDAIGIVRMNVGKFWEPVEHPVIAPLGGYRVSIQSPQPVHYNHAALTRAGQQILSLAGSPIKNQAMADDIMEMLRSHGMQIEIVD
jgi:hypothetical protein